MKILLLAHSFNSLTQRLFVELRQRCHDVTVELDINDAVTTQAIELARPDVVIAPFLKRAIPENVWRKVLCLIVHPGPEGDRGPAALDWAILENRESWGVTVLQAEADMDAGPIWASRTFPMRQATKSSLYRNEITEAAVEAVLEALAKHPTYQGRRPSHSYFKPATTQQDRAIDWSADDTATVLRKIRSADGSPGLLDQNIFLFDAHSAPSLSGPPGTLLATSNGSVARATTDGAIWIGHARQRHPLALKRPAAQVLDVTGLPEQPGAHDLWYNELHGVGYIHFHFHNGAMTTGQCERLQQAFHEAAQRPTKVIALMGSPDCWSNGIHLSSIEAAHSPADESWRNITAMNNLCKEIITCTSHITMAALHGNAGAGGVFMALAADIVLARHGVVLNPHYKGMGNLYGSEFWTYLLPKRCGPERAQEITQARLPMGTQQAKDWGLIHSHFGKNPTEFRHQVETIATTLAADPTTESRLTAKRLDRLADEQTKPLDSYAVEELERMKLNFYGFDPSYHVARYSFIHKLPKSRTPLYLAGHRA